MQHFLHFMHLSKQIKDQAEFSHLVGLLVIVEVIILFYYLFGETQKPYKYSSFYIIQKFLMIKYQNIVEENPQIIDQYPNTCRNLNVSQTIGSKHQKLNIIFKDLKYSVQTKDHFFCFQKAKKKRILSNITGICKGGQISAIMGPSGAGKTTLLNILACRIKPQSGQLLINHRPYSYSNFGKFANYVMQKDVLMETLTVRETLQFVAKLKIREQQKQRNKIIFSLCKKLKIDKCLDVLVGGKLVKGISGGQKKRLSIAAELISNPQVIMLDQPTSGLDSLTSYIIIDFLSQLAHQEGKTILMTIHQPNSEIFNKFDRLFLLAEGSLIYQGSAAKGVEYFAAKLNKSIPQFMNPGDFFMQQMHQGNQKNKQNLNLFYKSYKNNQKLAIQQQIKSVKQQKITFHRSCNNVQTQNIYSALLNRDFINTLRNPIILKSRIFVTVFLSVFTGGLYFSAGRKDYTNVIYWQAIVGYFFFLSIANMMISLIPISQVFASQRQIFLKQESSRLYSVGSYFVTKNLVQIPYIVIFSMLFNLIIYWMVGQASTLQQFFVFYLACFLVNMACSSFGLLIGTVSKDQKSVAAFAPLVIIPILVFSGVFKNRANIPSWISWFEYVSPLKYGFESSILNETKYHPSLVGQLNFNLQISQSILALVFLTIVLRLLSFYTLWMFKKKIQ